MKRSLQNAAVRLGLIPITGLCALLSARILLSDGTALYAAIALIWSIPQLLPPSDLGMGATLTNRVARSPYPQRLEHDEEVMMAARSILRMLVLTSVVFGVGAVLVLALPGLLVLMPAQSAAVNTRLAVGASLSLMGAGVVLSLWQRIAIGADKYQAVAVVAALAPPLSLGLTAIFAFSGNWTWAAISPAISGALIASVGAFYVSKSLGFPYATVFRSSFTESRLPTREVFPSGLAMVVITVAQPLALQSDRFVLGYVSGPRAVAEYSLASQLYLPALSVVSAGAVALWPQFTRARSSGEFSQRIIVRAGGSQVLIAGVVGLGMAVLGPVVTGVIAGQPAHLDVLFAFAVLLLVQALTMVPGMILTEPSELRYQACFVVIMLLANLPISVVLSRFGPGGPIWSSAITVLLLQFVPLSLRVTRTLRQGVNTDLSVGDTKR